MNLTPTIATLRAELDAVIRVIAQLEQLRDKPPRGKRRGRKSMGPDERREVSERMKKYWAGRRAQ